MKTEVEFNATFEVTFTVDGSTTYVDATCMPGPYHINFLIKTADYETMKRQALDFLQGWLDANGPKVFGHILN